LIREFGAKAEIRFQAKCRLDIRLSAIKKRGLTDFHITSSVQQHVIAFNVTVNNVLAVEMSESFAGLRSG
jgi:hypothetical protein